MELKKKMTKRCLLDLKAHFASNFSNITSFLTQHLGSYPWSCLDFEVDFDSSMFDVKNLKNYNDILIAYMNAQPTCLLFGVVIRHSWVRTFRVPQERKIADIQLCAEFGFKYWFPTEDPKLYEATFGKNYTP